MTADTIFDDQMRVVFNAEPPEVKRRLNAKYPDSWVKVCVGTTGLVVSVEEYLYEDKYRDVLAMLRELLRKHDLPLYRRKPDRLETYLEATALRIIELVLDKK